MAQGKLRYDKMVEDALRGVLREALTITATQGLPGQHHFYITFRTRHPGVVLPEHVRARHPDEMTIVLQHQFWGLEVGDDAFEVTLSFNRVNERLRIPFAAVVAFADPSAKFGLQFQVEIAGQPVAGAAPMALPSEPGPATADKPPVGDGGGQVIALDAFRKK